ncbi:Karyogamy protein KAR9 [Labeo rohita]|uniref:Karyogamy protein KAR9 n=1 Tax=Labeo rohita TaxID=84645 RepID=A0ABQ8MS96_LABRO|nr:Karyogamy protein KAR9 [Labeo rohita]
MEMVEQKCFGEERKKTQTSYYSQVGRVIVVHCKENHMLSEPILITQRAKILIFTRVVEGISNYYKVCSNCRMTFRYQEFTDFNDHLLISNPTAVSRVLSLFEATENTKFCSHDTVLHGYMHFEALTNHTVKEKPHQHHVLQGPGDTRHGWSWKWMGSKYLSLWSSLLKVSKRLCQLTFVTESLKHFPNVTIYDFAKGLATHTNLQEPEILPFRPHEDRLAEQTPENIQLAKKSKSMVMVKSKTAEKGSHLPSSNWFF